MRVIAGMARGRPLRAPTDPTTRPTSDKIKAVIFSMLEAEALKRGFEPEEGDEEKDGRFAAAVAWPRVLELYAGSGALAIEALSRGARHADLVEASRDARQAITANLQRTGLAERAAVHGLTSERAVSTFRGPYDLILLDPPYDADGVLTVIDQLGTGHLLERSGIVVWEHRRSVTPPEHVAGADGAPRLQLMRTRSHGTASVTLYGSAADN
jgi:16S rRNA (guanine966-N2)-methyltransferase